MKIECLYCLYFEQLSDTQKMNSSGFCRKYPPRVVPLENYPMTVWPEVHASNFCGEGLDKFPGRT